MQSVPLIADDATLHTLMERLKHASCLALDTEASSFHRYHERIGLIQLSDRTDTFLVDPLAVKDMGPLGQVLADRDLEIVIHDADYDLRLMKRMYDFRVFKVFDTLIAAELLNEAELSLAALLKKYYGIQLDKRYQKADWCKRPLTQPMLDYAAMDTRHLIALRDELAGQLKARGRWHWAEEEFSLLTEVPFDPVGNPVPGFLRLKGAKALKPKQLAILKEVHAWRESVAERLDRAPFMVLGNDVLMDLVQDPPTDLQALAERKGVGPSTVQKSGKDILRALQVGQDMPKDRWPKVERPKRYDRDPEFENRFKRLKATRDRLMQEWELRPGVVSSNSLLTEIARSRPDSMIALGTIPGMRKWQIEVFGEALLKAV